MLLPGGSCNTVEDPFRGICAPNKIKDVSSKVFNIIKGTNVSKELIKLFQVNSDVNLMVENVIQNKNGIMISFNVSIENQ